MLRVLAISAPNFISNGKIEKSYAFNSKTPFSLQNALRDAVGLAKNKIGCWGASNMADEESRNNSVILMEYWQDERSQIEQLLIEIKPNLLLIGAMTLSFPGAIEVAALAKKILGDNVCIVLGGKHTNESFFKTKEGVMNLHCSPLRLMAEKKIPTVFDIVVSGDGEKLVTQIGEVVAKLEQRSIPVTDIFRYKNILAEAAGDWLAGYRLPDDSIAYVQPVIDTLIDYNDLAFSVDQYHLSKGFGVFGTDFTAHAYSDMSKGCAYNCFFCSEKSAINGKLRIKSDIAPLRLFRQFYLINNKLKIKYPGKTISVFIEDSILLGGHPDSLNSFYRLMSENNISIPFGAQFTLDTFLFEDTFQIIQKLREVGLTYVAFGVETQNEEIANSFSKNFNRKQSWLTKTEDVVRKCKELNISCGMFLLWGLGETQQERVTQLRQIILWKYKYKINIEVGLNIATLHPLRDLTNSNSYTEWGTDISSPYLKFFAELFGEASERYKVNEKNFPTIEDLKELKEVYEVLKDSEMAYA